jgi:hypothetical protein
MRDRRARLRAGGHESGGDTYELVSEVAEHFREAVRARLGPDQQELLRDAAGTGAQRELRRAEHLTDRAVRQWAARAAADERPGHESAYARLPLLRPELGRAVQEAVIAESKASLDAERELIAQMVWGIGGRLAGIDTEAPPLSSQDSLNKMAVEAAEILLAAGRVLADPEWVINEANEALRDLVRPD